MRAAEPFAALVGVALLALACGAATGCSRGTQDDGASPHTDNTRVNARDVGGAMVTPIDQGESAKDVAITAAIRRDLVASDSLSATAKNVKVITIDGRVTLRGEVANEGEHSEVTNAAVAVAGPWSVDDQLEITR